MKMLLQISFISVRFAESKQIINSNVQCFTMCPSLMFGS